MMMMMMMVIRVVFLFSPSATHRTYPTQQDCIRPLPLLGDGVETAFATGKRLRGPRGALTEPYFGCYCP